MIWYLKKNHSCTGESVSEALILKSVNPQYGDNLLIDLQLQYKKNTSSEHVEYKKNSKHFLYTTCNSMNNLLSYCGLTDARMRASEKKLPAFLISRGLHY